MKDISSIQQLRTKLQDLQFKPGQVKTGELGGGQETPFEQAFSNLAHSYLKDRAPKLLDFEVGFQLIEKNQDNTKACGVFGFKVGQQWIYAPVFFLNGDLKGHELLYLKNQDHFVPLAENWIDHILGKKPAVLGDGVNRNLSMLGVMPPNLYQLSKSPQKFASDQSGMRPPMMASWARDVLPVLAHAAFIPLDKQANVSLGLSLPTLLKEGGEPVFRYLLEKVGSVYPTLIQSVDEFYPGLLDEVAQDIAIKRAAAAGSNLYKSAMGACCVAPPKPPKPKKPRPYKSKAWRGKRASIAPSSEIGPIEALPEGVKHKVISKEMAHTNPDVLHELDSKERETLLKERIVFKDTRDKKDVTIAYDVQLPLKLRNPDRTAVYEVLVQPDQFEKCLVIMSPYSNSKRQNFCTVVRLDGDKNYTNTHPANVWVANELDTDSWKKWWDGLPDANNIPLANRDNPWRDKKRYVLIGLTGEGTCPFQAREEYTGGADESVVYDVRFEDHNYSRRPGWVPDHGKCDYDLYEGCPRAEQLILTKQPGRKLTVSQGSVSVPDGYKMLKVRDEDNASESNNQALRLGDLLSVQLAITANTHPLRIISNGKDITVNKQYMDKESAVICLFQNHGLRKEAAEVIVNRRGTHEYRLVYPPYIKEAMNKHLRRGLVGAAGVTGAVAGTMLGHHLAKPYGKAERIGFPVGHGIGGGGGAAAVANSLLPEADKDDNDHEKKGVDPGNDMIRGAPNAPSFPEPYIGYDPMTGGNVPTMQKSEFNLKIPDMSASKTDRSIYYPFGPDSKALGVAQQAAQTGQKEVFDTAMLGGLLKSMRQDSMVDKYMGDLMKGLDRLGRLLFQYYWHGEEFEDRYGKQDMPELEDGLRNTFEGMGDTILALKKKSVEPYPDEGNVDLGPVANQ